MPTINTLGIGDYALYMFDFGSPVGFRIALDHDQRVRAIITQNGNAYTDGFGPGVAALSAWWGDRHAGQAVLDLPGRADYMKALLWDYQNNPPHYSAWQAWLRARQPKVLAIWGKNDPFFIPAGAQAYKKDVPDATVVLLDTGHFALEEEADTIAEHTNALGL